jgi:hypothetical protein
MPPISLAFAKNVARRAFTQLVDPAPNAGAVERLWAYFEGRCAYCERPIDRSRKEGHIDHLLSASAGGGNDLSNRVLSCASCNEKEKRDAPWDEFLLAKAPDAESHRARAARILTWQRDNAAPQPGPDRELLALARAAGDEVALLIDQKAAEIRRSRRERMGAQTSLPSLRQATSALPNEPRSPSEAREPVATYRASRLEFRADAIEALAVEDVFRVVTPAGKFQMTKAEFYAVFANVVASESYRVRRSYSYSALPQKAVRFRVSS